MQIAIAIPARYGSKRFPGKPLAKIAGQSMLSRVVDVAKEAAAFFDAIDYLDITCFITTEDERIQKHAKELGVTCIMTPDDCKTGSDRVLAALRQIDEWPDFVINFQGDAPFTSPYVIKTLIEAFVEDPETAVITPVHRLSWDALDELRMNKEKTPFSGTTALVDEKTGRAIWFSKSILPAIRNEDTLRLKKNKSPVYQHIGLYGYRVDVLEKFCLAPQSHYEILEGLEQLRLIENGIDIQCVKIESEYVSAQSGIDTPEDLERAERILAARQEHLKQA